jgi:hypothetical protein
MHHQLHCGSAYYDGIDWNAGATFHSHFAFVIFEMKLQLWCW